MKKIILSFSIAALLMSGCYKDDINDLKDKYEALKAEQAQLLQNYQTVLNALQNQVTVTSVVPTADGYSITFSDGSKADLKHGNNGANGVDGDNGVDGVDAPTIVDIVIQDGNVAFTFSNGDTIVIPMTENFACYVSAAAVQCFGHEDSRIFNVHLTGVQNMAIAKPDGWKVSINGDKMTVTAPASGNPYAEYDGMISLIATGDGATAIANMKVKARALDYNHLIDFEGADVLDFLAGPTAAGENLYESTWSNPDGVPVIGVYQNAATGLYMTINESFGEVNFWNGGVAVSRWNDMLTEGLPNQCSVFYKDDVTGFGGYDGSQTFAIANPDGRISFDDGATECTFDHFWVTNSTYVALSMMKGDMFAKQFSYEDKDWFKLIITAFDKDEQPTGTPVDFYLADFRTATSSGILTEWTMVDLTPLGNSVHTIKFDLQSSDEGDWGMNTPAYFCFDNLAVKK